MPDQITRLLDEVERLDRNAAQGPWATDSTPHEVGVIYGAPRLENGYVKRSILTNFVEDEAANADFIALARTAMPAMAKAVSAVLELHKPEWSGGIPPGGYICAECQTPVESEPCETVHAITDALGDSNA